MLVDKQQPRPKTEKQSFTIRLHMLYYVKRTRTTQSDRVNISLVGPRRAAAYLAQQILL